MPLDFSRIESVIDVRRTQAAEVAVIGLGGSVTLISDLARCGVRKFKLVDFDVIEPTNVARQDHDASRIGMTKAAAVTARLREINPDVEVEAITADFTKLSEAELEQHLSGMDLLIMATDSFPAQAAGNQLALRRGIPVVFIGLYEEGAGGEVAYWYSDLDACFRCLCADRYAAFATPQPPVITSRGASILDIRLVDGIAGMIAVGLLTRGATNRYGRLIAQLGDRNFLQIKIDPTFGWNGRDLFRELLQIPEDNAAYFSFVTVARSDPDRGQLYCPDCEQFRGHRFVETNGVRRRIKPAPTTASPESDAALPSSSVSVPSTT